VGGAMNRKTHVESFSKIVGKTNSHPCSMKPFLDPPNSKNDNYISSSHVSDPPNQSFRTAATVTRVATISDQANTIFQSILDPDHPAPDIATELIGIREWSFLIDTFNMDAAIMIRPIRFKEKCRVKEKCRIVGISEKAFDDAAGYKTEMVDRHLSRTEPHSRKYLPTYICRKSKAWIRKPKR
jgi:hypothetical protein